MNTFRITCGLAGGMLALTQAIPYILSIFYGTTKPSRPAYLIWTITDCIAAGSYIALGARTTIWWSIAQIITSLIILLIAFKHGMGGSSIIDRFCLLMAATAITLWIVTGDAKLALYATVLAGLMGYIPTLIKVYYHPWSESFASWTLTLCSTVFNMLAIDSLQFHLIVIPLTSFLSAALITFVLWNRKERVNVLLQC
jgi:hypothetical protein